MHRYRVSGERIEDKYVECLYVSISQFEFHREPRVARHDVDFRARVLQICEVSILTARDFSDRRIDLVEANIVAGKSVGGDRSDAESDRSHPDRAVAKSARETARTVEHD